MPPTVVARRGHGPLPQWWLVGGGHAPDWASVRIQFASERGL